MLNNNGSQSEGVTSILDEGISAIKSSGTDEEKLRIAQETRMEIQLTHAALAVDLMDTIQEQGVEIDREVLEEVLNNHRTGSDGQMVGQFLDSIVKSVKEVRKIKEKSEDEEQIKLEIFLSQVNNPRIKAILGSFRLGKYLMKDVDMIIHPLAVELRCNNHFLFTLVDKRENVNGYFQNRVLGAPVIVTDITKTKDPDNLQRHEVIHAQNSTVKMGQAGANRMPQVKRNEDGTEEQKERTIDRNHVWGNPDILPSSRLSKKIDVLEDQESRGEPLNENYYNATLKWVLGRSKDEVIAYMFETGYSRDTKMISVEEIYGTMQSEIYDFVQMLGLNPDSQLYKRLKSDYNRLLIENLNSASIVVNNLRNADYTKRERLFRWVLTQIPIDKWGEQLRRTGYLDESVLLSEANKTNLECFGAIETFFENEDYELLDSIKSRFQIINRTYQNYINSNATKPLSEFAESHIREIQGLASRIPEYENRVLFSEISRLIEEGKLEINEAQEVRSILGNISRVTDQVTRSSMLRKLHERVYHS